MLFSISFLWFISSSPLLQTLRGLRGQRGHGDVSVEVNAAPGQDLKQRLDQLRCEYENIIEQNRKEVEAWYESKASEIYLSRLLVFQWSENVNSFHRQQHIEIFCGLWWQEPKRSPSCRLQEIAKYLFVHPQNILETIWIKLGKWELKSRKYGSQSPTKNVWNCRWWERSD